MAVSRKVEREIERTKYLEKIAEFLSEKCNEEVLKVKSNEICFPIVGCEGNEDWIVVTVKIPTGANKGTEPYDGYELAEDYQMKLSEKERKKEEAEKKKAEKIRKDKEIREKKKTISEKGE